MYKTSLNAAMAKFLRYLSDELDSGKCTLSDETMVTIFNAVSDGYNKASRQNVTRDAVLDSLGRAYAYLSERTDALETEMEILTYRHPKVHKVNFNH